MPDEESVSDGATLGADSSAGNSQDSYPAEDQISNPQGYERLANMMAEYPANAVFRQFGSLSTLNLLYYQAELAQLETDLCEAAKLDRDSTDRCRQLYFQNFRLLSNGVTDNDDLAVEAQVQWKLVLKMRRVLKEYSKSSLTLRRRL
jgi:hypothetical protein